MNKIITLLGIVAIAVFGWFLFSAGTTVEYAATVETEVAELERELAEVEAAVAAGTLSPAAAAAAQVAIVARIDAINQAVEAGGKAKLTDAQRVQLVEGLNRLQRVLTTYQATLVIVDDRVMQLPEADRPQLNARGSRTASRGVATIAAEAIVSADEQVEEIVETIEDEALATEVEGELEESVVVVEDETMIIGEVEVEGDVEGADPVSADEVEVEVIAEDTVLLEPVDDTTVAGEASVEAESQTEVE